MAALLCEDVPAAITCFEQSIEHYRALGDRFYLACLHRNYGILHLVLNQSDRSHQLLAQSAALCREIGDSTGLAQPVATLGWFVYNDGYFVEAGEHWQEARALCLETGARYALINVQLGLIWVDIFYHGDFYTAAALAEELRAIALDLDDSQSKHRMLLVDGFLAGISEDYQTCQRCFQDAVALEFPYFPYTASLEAMGLCLAACGLERAPDTTKQLEKVLSISLINRWPANAAKAMALAAVLAAKAGNPQRATELLSLAFQHPLSPKGWLIRWPLITRLQDELKAALTPAGFAAAWEHGGNLDLMATAAAVAAELA